MRKNILQGLLKLMSVFVFLSTTSLQAESENNTVLANKYSILVGSPIRQKSAILREFLESLDSLDQSRYSLSYFFVDDNEDTESSQLLKEFAQKHHPRCHIRSVIKSSEEDVYVCDEKTHVWKDSLIWKVAGFKDEMIQYARDHKYDYLFLVDSDIVLNPKTVGQLIDANKDIVSNIFWTCWSPDALILPQVWMVDHYTQYELASGEKISEEEAKNRLISFLIKMRTPGTYEVGGLGACTLISKQALVRDISFKKLKNITYAGEDRHFCIRAVALGLDLYVDTHYPAYHIYRESALSDVEDFKRSVASSCNIISNKKPRITLSMIMKNEADRYLRKVLESARSYITDAVIIDDASTDNSVALCKEILDGIPVKIIQNQTSKFSNEISLRKQQWKETIKTNPEWIVFLDADEVFEKDFHQEIHKLISSPNMDAFYFRLYDLWDEEHYREDQYWQAHNHYRPFLVRYRSDIPYTWNTETAQHCGRFPSTVLKLIGTFSSMRLKHYGWANEKDRSMKYERYKILDPDAKYGIKEQYESILDQNPSLLAWKE